MKKKIEAKKVFTAIVAVVLALTVFSCDRDLLGLMQKLEVEDISGQGRSTAITASEGGSSVTGTGTATGDTVIGSGGTGGAVVGTSTGGTVTGGTGTIAETGGTGGTAGGENDDSLSGENNGTVAGTDIPNDVADSTDIVSTGTEGSVIGDVENFVNNGPDLTIYPPTYTDIPGLDAPIIDGSNITFTAPGTYKTYAWYLDSVTSGSKSQDSVYTFDISELSAEGHFVMLVVTDDSGKSYSAQYGLTIHK